MKDCHRKAVNLFKTCKSCAAFCNAFSQSRCWMLMRRESRVSGRRRRRCSKVDRLAPGTWHLAGFLTHAPGTWHLSGEYWLFIRGHQYVTNYLIKSGLSLNCGGDHSLKVALACFEKVLQVAPLSTWLHHVRGDFEWLSM